MSTASFLFHFAFHFYVLILKLEHTLGFLIGYSNVPAEHISLSLRSGEPGIEEMGSILGSVLDF